MQIRAVKKSVRSFWLFTSSHSHAKYWSLHCGPRLSLAEHDPNWGKCLWKTVRAPLDTMVLKFTNTPFGSVSYLSSAENLRSLVKWPQKQRNLCFINSDEWMNGWPMEGKVSARPWWQRADVEILGSTMLQIESCPNCHHWDLPQNVHLSKHSTRNFTSEQNPLFSSY
jgi:hypothetical protein